MQLLAVHNIFGTPGTAHLPEVYDVALRRLGIKSRSGPATVASQGQAEPNNSLAFNYQVIPE